MKIYTRYFALALLFLTSAICHAALQNGKVQVAITKGQSLLTNPQSIKEPIVKGKLFEQGYKVETMKDSTVELCLSNGSTILVNPETVIVITTFRQVSSNLIVEGAYQKLDKEPSPSVVEIFVIKGKIIGEARKLNPQSSFTIKSPAGVARIRGTVFTVEYQKNDDDRTGNMEVSCVKGSVEVTLFGSDSGSVPVEPGRKLTVEKVETAVAVDPITNEVTFNKPITVEVGVELKPMISGPVISYSRLSPEDIRGISNNLSTGTSVPAKLTDDIQQIANNTPPIKPGEDNDTPPPPPSNNTGPATGPTNNPTDNINNMIQNIIEKETQKNPSPTGG